MALMLLWWLAASSFGEADSLLTKAAERLIAMDGFSVVVERQQPQSQLGKVRVRIDRGELGRWRIDHGLPGSYWVSDGLKWLIVIGPSKEYREASEGKMVRGMREYLTQLLLRHEGLALRSERGRLKGRELLTRGGRRIECWRIDVTSGNKSDPSWERLWIEPGTALIWQSWVEPGRLSPALGDGLDGGPGAPVPMRGTLTRYDWISVDRPEREAVFDATPPRGFRPGKVE